MSDDSWVYIDGRVVPAAEARISVFDRGFLYGDSVFEVTRTVERQPLLLEPHLGRLGASAAGMAMALPPLELIRQAVAESIAAVAAPDCYLRIIVTRGAGPLDLDPAAADEPKLVVIARPLRLPEPALYQHGAAVVTVAQRRNAPGQLAAEIKSGNYASSVLALHSARQRGAYEALMCDLDGFISEGASSNFFVIVAGRLVTPPLSLGMLAGITRAAVLELAAEAGLTVVERPFRPDEAAGASEAFLTSSIRGILPVTRLDGRPLGDGQPGPIYQRLSELYAARYLERRSSASPSRNSSSSSPT